MTKVQIDESLALRSRFFEASVDLFAISDLTGHVIDVNDALLSTFGYIREEVIGKTWFEHIHEADWEASIREFEKTAATGKSIALMNRMRCKSGDYKLIEWDTSICPVTNMVFTLGRDISDSRRSYETLLAEISLQKAIIDGADFGIISTDENGNIQTFNRPAERMLSYKAQEVVGYFTPQAFFDANELRAHALELSREFGAGFDKSVDALFVKARAGFVEERNFSLKKRDGRTFKARVCIGALRNEAAEIYAFLIVMRELLVKPLQ